MYIGQNFPEEHAALGTPPFFYPLANISDLLKRGHNTFSVLNNRRLRLNFRSFQDESKNAS